MALRDSALDQPEPAPVGWCPACRKLRPVTLTGATTEWQVDPVFACDTCGAVTHEPFNRIAPVAPEIARVVEM